MYFCFYFICGVPCMYRPSDRLISHFRNRISCLEKIQTSIMEGSVPLSIARPLDHTEVSSIVKLKTHHIRDNVFA